MQSSVMKLLKQMKADVDRVKEAGDTTTGSKINVAGEAIQRAANPGEQRRTGV
jgi:hypothetical protein